MNRQPYPVATADSLEPSSFTTVRSPQSFHPPFKERWPREGKLLAQGSTVRSDMNRGAGVQISWSMNEAVFSRAWESIRSLEI